MSALGFLAATSAMIGGLPPFHRGRRRRKRKPDPDRERDAAKKRQDKAAKRAEDERRTAEGRAAAWRFTNQWDWAGQPMGVWDRVERWWRGHDDDEQAPPRWWQRLNHRRSLPWTPLAWVRW